MHLRSKIFPHVNRLRSLKRILAMNFLLDKDAYYSLPSLCEVCLILTSCTQQNIGKEKVELMKILFDEVNENYLRLLKMENEAFLSLLNTIAVIDLAISQLEGIINLNGNVSI